VALSVWAVACEPVAPTERPASSTVAGTTRGADASPSGGATRPWVVLDQPIPKRDFALTDQSGRRFRFVAGTETARVTLLYFGYTHCADICPDTLARATVALRGSPPDVAAGVRFVFVTVDPARDDVDRVREWVGLFNRDFVGLTGPQRRIDRVQRLYGSEPAPRIDLGGGEYTVGHPAEVLAFTSDGSAHVAFPYGMAVEEWILALTDLVREGWRG
jgi:protein SCO1/2